jgi:adenylosuccinate synthase
VAGRFVARLNGFDSIAVMKLDILDRMPSLKICTAYRLNGEVIDTLPATPAAVAACEPIYEEWPGWETSTACASRWDDLPENARRSLERLAELLETPLALVSVGPGRGETLHIRELPL